MKIHELYRKENLFIHLRDNIFQDLFFNNIDVCVSLISLIMCEWEFVHASEMPTEVRSIRFPEVEITGS